MKKMVLTNAELGTYASSSGSVTMKYHDSSNVYATSKVKEFLEGTYINTLGEFNLKEIDGYKIRLITVDELINNLGWKTGTDTSVTYDGNSVPDWVYKNMGG